MSYPRGCYGAARRQIGRILARLDDAQPRIEKSGVPGIFVVRSSLDNRHVVAQCAALCHAEPDAFRFAIKWVPVDYWCERSLDAIERLVKDEVAPRIGAQDTWAMLVEKRGWTEYHTAQIIRRLAEAIDRPVRLKNPDKLVRIDILGAAVAVSLLRQGETFSIYSPP